MDDLEVDSLTGSCSFASSSILESSGIYSTCTTTLQQPPQDGDDASSMLHQDAETTSSFLSNDWPPVQANSEFYQKKLHEFIRMEDASGWHQQRLCTAFLMELGMDSSDESLHAILDHMIHLMTKRNHPWQLWRCSKGTVNLSNVNYKDLHRTAQEHRDASTTRSDQAEWLPTFSTSSPSPVPSILMGVDTTPANINDVSC